MFGGKDKGNGQVAALESQQFSSSGLAALFVSTAPPGSFFGSI